MANYAKSNTSKDIFSLFLTTLFFLILTVSKPVTSQNCGCASDFCCSQYGYCGQTDDYCGDGCREGPCGGSGRDAVSLEGTVTPEFFNSILNQARSDCAGKGFYSHNAFIAAANSYPSFGSSISKREIAAFLLTLPMKQDSCVTLRKSMDQLMPGTTATQATQTSHVHQERVTMVVVRSSSRETTTMVHVAET